MTEVLEIVEFKCKKCDGRMALLDITKEGIKLKCQNCGEVVTVNVEND